MNWEKLYSMQQQLDAYISDNHKLEGKDLFSERYLALLVELGELANETRCFKFWSNKKRSADAIILDEYVDGVHFLLSIGLEKNYRYPGNEIKLVEVDETKQFNEIFTKAAIFKQDPSLEKYIALFEAYVALGKLLGYSETAIQEAYFKKNEINFERQDTGY